MIYKQLRLLIKETIQEITQDIEQVIYLINYYVRFSKIPKSYEDGTPFNSRSAFKKLKEILKTGQLRHLFKQPENDIYRGILVDKEWVKKFGIKNDKLYSGGTRNWPGYKSKSVNIDYRPGKTGFSSWSTSLKYVKHYLYYAWDNMEDEEDMEDTVMFIFKTDPSSNRNAFALESLYKIFKWGNEDRSYEEEVIVFGTVKVNEIIWSYPIDSSVHNLEKLSNDKNEHIRRELAKNYNTPIHILEKLSNDEISFVRKAVAYNPSTPVHVLEKLANDKDSTVKTAAQENLLTRKKK